MILIRTAATAALLLVTAPGQAQTIEEAYAEQCAKGQKNETCDALREALLKKLHGLGSTATSVTEYQPQHPIVTEQASPVLTDAQKAQWGVIADMAGKHWVYSIGAAHYEWLEIGKRLKLEVFGNTGGIGTQYMRPSSKYPGKLEWILETPDGLFVAGHLTPFRDGAVYWKPGKVVWKKASSGLIKSVGAKLNKDGTYTERGEVLDTLRLVSPTEFRNVIAERNESRRQRIAAKRDNSGDFGANILLGAMKGFSEGTASNQAMEQSLQDAASRGLAQGAAEYARRQADAAHEEAEQRQASAEYASQVRAREEAEQRARQAAEQARALTQRQATQPAEHSAASAEKGPLQGFWGKTCEAARLNATGGAGSTAGNVFEEVHEIPQENGCLVQGYRYGGHGAVSSQ